MFLGACALGDVVQVTHPSVTGTVTVTRTDGTQTHWTADTCQSGAVEYFVGFDFLSSQNPSQFRAVLDPIEGPIVRWKPDAAQPSQTFVFRRSECTQLDLDVHQTGWRVNDVREFAGTVDMRCRNAEGVVIEGRLAVDHCH